MKDSISIVMSDQSRQQGAIEQETGGVQEYAYSAIGFLSCTGMTRMSEFGAWAHVMKTFFLHQPYLKNLDASSDKLPSLGGETLEK